MDRTGQEQIEGLFAAITRDLWKIQSLLMQRREKIKWKKVDVMRDNVHFLKDEFFPDPYMMALTKKKKG